MDMPLLFVCLMVRLHHTAHTTSCACKSLKWAILLLLGQDALGSEEHRGDRGSILLGYGRLLRWVDDTCSEHILVAVVTSVVAKGALALLNIVHNN